MPSEPASRSSCSPAAATWSSATTASPAPCVLSAPGAGSARRGRRRRSTVTGRRPASPWDDVVAGDRRRRLVRARVPLRHPRLGRRHPDPERRRVRPGGRRDRSPRSRCTTGWPARCVDDAGRRVRLRVPDQRLPAQRPLGRALGRRSGCAARRCPPRCATPSWPGRSASTSGDRVPLAEARAAVLALRAGKGMVLDPADPDTCSVGSFFTNPVLDAAGVRGAARPGRAALGRAAAWPGRTGRSRSARPG